MTTVAIVGSRDYVRLDDVRRFVEALPPGTIVVSGGARGVDTAAIEAAAARGLATKVYPADWMREGKRAGYLRNYAIVDAADEVVAFWDGASRGTAHTITLAQVAGKPVRIIRPYERPAYPDLPGGQNHPQQFGSWQLVKQVVRRIGVETLWRHPDGRWAVTLRNRSYASRCDIPPERVAAWLQEFGIE
jgi:hypothetical protein